MRWLLLSLVLPLTACLDVEADFVVGEDETITAQTKMTLGRQLYDMMQLAPQAEGLCPANSQKIESPESVTCTTTDTVTIDEVIAEAAEARSEDPFMGDVEITRVDDETLRVVLPLDFENIEGRPAELSEDNPMFSMMTDGLKGAQIVVRFSALEVLESNGAISEDGTSVELVVPTVELLQPSGTLPETFTAVLKYRNCGLFGC